MHDAKAAELAAQAKEVERARDAVSVANNKTKAMQATLRAEQDAHAATRTKLDELTRLYQQVPQPQPLPQPLSIALSLIYQCSCKSATVRVVCLNYSCFLIIKFDRFVFQTQIRLTRTSV